MFSFVVSFCGKGNLKMGFVCFQAAFAFSGCLIRIGSLKTQLR
ncbi:MAG: hypothetical protein ACFNNL_01805 [Kingella oralis]